MKAGKKKGNKRAIMIKGDGYIFVYMFDEEFINEALIPAELREKFDGGFGAVILANYNEGVSEKYTDIYFIPGKFEIDGETKYLITKAYTSSEAGLKDGLFCKKEKADFTVEESEDEGLIFSFKSGRLPVFSVQISDMGFDFPVSSDLISFPLMEIRDGKKADWEYNGKGSACFCRMESVEVRPSKFPDVAQYTPIASVHIKEFTLEAAKKEK